MRVAAGAHTYQKDENETKQNIHERQRKTTRHLQFKKNARRIRVRATCGFSTMASEPARARLLCAILSLVFPVTFGQSTKCHCPALTFSAALHFISSIPDAPERITRDLVKTFGVKGVAGYCVIVWVLYIFCWKDVFGWDGSPMIAARSRP